MRLGISFYIGQNGPLSANYNIIVHLQQGVSDDVSNTRHCRYYPERGYRMGDRETVEALQ